MELEFRRTGRSLRQLQQACEKFDKFIYVIYPIQSKDYYLNLMRDNGLDISKATFKGLKFIEMSDFKGCGQPVLTDHRAYDQTYSYANYILELQAHNHRFEVKND